MPGLLDKPTNCFPAEILSITPASYGNQFRKLLIRYHRMPKHLHIKDQEFVRQIDSGHSTHSKLFPCRQITFRSLTSSGFSKAANIQPPHPWQRDQYPPPHRWNCQTPYQWRGIHHLCSVQCTPSPLHILFTFVLTGIDEQSNLISTVSTLPWLKTIINLASRLDTASKMMYR